MLVTIFKSVFSFPQYYHHYGALWKMWDHSLLTSYLSSGDDGIFLHILQDCEQRTMWYLHNWIWGPHVFYIGHIMSLPSKVGHTSNNPQKSKHRTKVITQMLKTFGNVRTMDSFFSEVIYLWVKFWSIFQSLNSMKTNILNFIKYSRNYME